ILEAAIKEIGTELGEEYHTQTDQDLLLPGQPSAVPAPASHLAIAIPDPTTILPSTSDVVLVTVAENARKSIQTNLPASMVR
ncbi:hypothetical protein E4U55_000117, partial [Claviceps digitariae]